jgi:hypothetical protein
MKLDENERYFIMNNIKSWLQPITVVARSLKLGSTFLHPRPEMINNTSNTLCSNRSKEGKGFLPDKIGRTQLLKTRVSRWKGQSQMQGEKGTCKTIMKIIA